MSEFVEIKTADLIGAALDWAVMVCVKGEKTKHEFEDGKLYLVVSRELMGHCQEISQPFMPSARWQEGGPLILNYGVSLRCIAPANAWEADRWDDSVIPSRIVEIEAETPLIAACRAIVASVLGETVSVPKELV